MAYCYTCYSPLKIIEILLHLKHPVTPSVTALALEQQVGYTCYTFLSKTFKNLTQDELYFQLVEYGAL